MKHLLLIVTALLSVVFARAASKELYLIIGSYAPAAEEGIQVFTFNQNTGAYQYSGGLKGIENPSYLTINKAGTRIYAVAENDSLHSTANALSFDKTSGRLKFLNKQLTYGAAPCYITLSPDESYAVTANYTGGSITLLPINQQGMVTKGHTIPFKGKGMVKGRQDQPHLHCIAFTPDKRLLLANDLGTDKIHVFPLDRKGLPFKKTAYDITLKPGSGPRHLCFAPNGKIAYLITELSGEVISLTYKNGRLTPQQYIKADSLNAMGSADIHISPDGRFVYASNRLKGDGIAIFKVDTTGKLIRQGYQPTGIHPRNFVLTPNGRYLLVACRDSNEIQIYERNCKTGLLSNTGRKISMSKPVCLKFTER